MTASDWQRVRDLFEQTVVLPQAKRREFLAQACGDNAQIKAEVEKLIEAEQRLDETSLFDKPVWEWNEMDITTVRSNRPIELPFTDEDRKKYRILKEIGHGGMGIVYLAYSSEREQEVAIKVMQGNPSKEDLRRFDDERRIHVRLDDNQHVVTFLGKGLLLDGHPYFVMKFVRGESLESRLKKGPLSFPRVIEITRQLGDALAFAHREGVIHRDIKPSNIMLSDVGSELRVKVLDFGIAILRKTDDVSRGDLTTHLVCTPSYASPEQAEGRSRDEIDHRSDIYSFACVVYEMLTGQRPFRGASPQQILFKRLTETPAPPSKVRPDAGISEAADFVLLKAMARLPEDRYNDARLFASELRAALTVDAPTIIVSPLRKGEWRKYALLVVAVLLLAALGGAALQYWGGSLISNGARENDAKDAVINNTNQNAHKSDEGNESIERLSDNNSNSDRETSREDAPSRSALDIELIHQTSGGEGAVAFDRVFRSGDAVRWNIEPEQTGYLYIVFKGSSGRVSIFYPNPRESGSYNQVQAGNRITFPKNGVSIRFDERPGNETYYFVFAARKGETSLAELEKAVEQKRMTLNQEEGQRIVAALQKQAASKESDLTVRVIELHHQ